MTELADRLDILTRNASVLEMAIWEKDIEDKHVGLTKEMYLLSKVEIANNAVIGALKFIKLGSVEEIDDYRDENNM